MRKIYFLLVSLTVAAASLTSCSKSVYSFNNAAPAYLGTQPMAAVKVAPAPVAPPAVEALAPTPTISTQAVDAPVAERIAPAAASVAVAPTVSATKPSLVQRLALKKLVKMQQKQATASLAHTAASKVGRAGLVILAGAIIILIGGLIGGANVVVTIGGVVFIVGLILLVLALLNS